MTDMKLGEWELECGIDKAGKRNSKRERNRENSADSMFKRISGNFRIMYSFHLPHFHICLQNKQNEIYLNVFMLLLKMNK